MCHVYRFVCHEIGLNLAAESKNFLSSPGFSATVPSLVNFCQVGALNLEEWGFHEGHINCADILLHCRGRVGLQSDSTLHFKKVKYGKVGTN